MFAMRGETVAPWAVPSSLTVHRPFSITPALSHFLTNEMQDPFVRNPVLDKLHQPFVIDGVKVATNVRIEHPAHLLVHDGFCECIQRIMLSPSGSKPIRETEEVHFVDGVE